MTELAIRPNETDNLHYTTGDGYPADSEHMENPPRSELAREAGKTAIELLRAREVGEISYRDIYETLVGEISHKANEGSTLSPTEEALLDASDRTKNSKDTVRENVLTHALMGVHLHRLHGSTTYGTTADMFRASLVTLEQKLPETPSEITEAISRVERTAGLTEDRYQAQEDREVIDFGGNKLEADSNYSFGYSQKVA